jgi:phosphatidylinositol glycan class V
MLCLLSRSIWSAFTGICVVEDHSEPKSKSKSRSVAGTETGRESSCDAILFRLALPQLALVVLASTTIHVQIINRLSSGYPLWYLLLARDIVEYRNPTGATKRVEWRHPNLHQTAVWTVRWMVMYALIQGALFASFLPPA